MKEKKKIFQNKKLLLIIPVLLVIAIVGITYAFFNYTRTGTANTIRVGRIAFNTTQASGQNGAIDLSNAFPISRTAAATDTDNSGEVVITITGVTDYSGGVEYLVTATGVTNTVGGKTLPISVIVTPSAGLGIVDSGYYTNRSSATSHIYKVEAGNNINNNDRILVGYIAPNTTSGTASGVNGTLTIKAFIDSSLIAISDTYPERTVYSVNGTGFTQGACETATGLTGGVCASAAALQEDLDNATPTLTPTQIRALETAGLVTEYTDGTTSEWVDGRTVLTTTEWNSLQSSGISFKVKVEANEGIWVKQIPTISLSPASGGVASGSSTTSTISTTGDGTMTCSSSNQSIATCSVSGSTLTINGVAVGNATITVNQAEGTNYTAGNTTYLATVEAPAYPTISSCEGCKFIYTKNEYFYSANNYNSSPISTLTTFENNNETLVDDYTTLNKNYFLGFKFDGNGVITNAYACGIKGTDYLNNEEQTPGVNAGTAFCVEGSIDGSTYSATNTFLNDSTTGIWQGRCDDSGSSVSCRGSVRAGANSYGRVNVGGAVGGCYVEDDGFAYCL